MCRLAAEIHSEDDIWDGAMNLTEREKEQHKAMIDASQPLPPQFKAVLFDQPHGAKLIRPGKTHDVTTVALPFQSIEQIDEPRAGTAGGTPDRFALDKVVVRRRHRPRRNQAPLPRAVPPAGRLGSTKADQFRPVGHRMWVREQ
jgi:hypothetical protein